MAIYERERARLGSHSAAALRLGIRRTTLYDWLEWARQHMTKLLTPIRYPSPALLRETKKVITQLASASETNQRREPAWRICRNQTSCEHRQLCSRAWRLKSSGVGGDAQAHVGATIYGRGRNRASSAE
jgi:transposase-like protein